MIAVLFDFNGVLVDDEDVHFEAFRLLLEVLGVTISHEVYRRYLGFDDRGTIVALLAHYGRGGDVDDRRAGAARRATSSAATPDWRAIIRGSASGRARWCWRCAPRARGWRSCRARGARRSTPCSTHRRCAIASTRSWPPRTSRAASPIPRLSAGARAAGRRRRQAAPRRSRSRTRPPGCARPAPRARAASASPRPVPPRSSAAPTRSCRRSPRSTRGH